MGELKQRVIALLKDPSDFDTYDEQADAIIAVCFEEATRRALDIISIASRLPKDKT